MLITQVAGGAGLVVKLRMAHYVKCVVEPCEEPGSLCVLKENLGIRNAQMQCEQVQGPQKSKPPSEDSLALYCQSLKLALA